MTRTLQKLFEVHRRELRIAVRLAKGLGIVGVLAMGAAGFGLRSLSVVTVGVLVLLGLSGLYSGRRFAGFSGSEPKDLAA
jgi:hypothetical protein